MTLDLSELIRNVREGGGETITSREQRDVRILVASEPLTLTWSRYGPGERGPDAHVHREHTDAFYVLAGELIFALGPAAKEVRVPAGGYVAVPPNITHAFRNELEVDTFFLNFHAPDKGFARSMRARRDGGDTSFDGFDPPADGGLPVDGVIVSQPGEGEPMVRANRDVLMKGVLPDLCLSEWALEGPYEGPEAHRHDDRVDLFYVVEGELEVTIEGTPHRIGADTIACAPPGVLHTFAHRGGGTVRVLNSHAPDGGFAEFLRRTSD